MNLFKTLFFTVGVCLLPQIAAFSAQTIDVEDAQVRGNDRIGSDAILNKISQKSGEKFSLKAIAEDIKNLYQMGYFDRIQVEKKSTPKGVKLTYVVHELPVVREITISGNDNYKTEDMLGDMSLKVYEVASAQKITRSLEKLREKYKEKGYYLAQLSTKFVPLDQPNEVKLEIEVQEHEQIRIRKIYIFGNEKFSDSELKGVLQSKEGNAMSWATSAGRYHELMFEQDVQVLRLWYLDHGYVKIQVKNPQVFISPDKRWVTMHFTVEEGEKYDFGEISFGGDLIFTADELRRSSHVLTGELFRSSILQKEMDRLGDMYGDLGYAFTNVIPQTTVHDEQPRRVDIRFDFEKGNKMHIQHILFSGNTKTYDKVLRREMRIFEGDMYGSTKVKTSRRNLDRTGYFGKVIFKEQVNPNDPSEMDLVVEVEEKPTGTLMVGAGFSSQDGFLAQGQVAQDNFLGTGQKIQFYAQLAGSRSRFQLTWDEPYMFDYNIRFGTALYYLDRGVYSNVGLSFVERKLGANVSFGRPLNDDMIVTLTHKVERVWLDQIFNENLIRRDDNEGWLSASALSYAFDTRNNRMRPTEGFYAFTSAELAGLSGALHFLKLLGNVRWYVPLFLGLVYRNNLSGGSVFPVFGYPIPVSERFVLGGIYDLRGYRPGSVGPMVCAEPTLKDDKGQPVFNTQNTPRFFCSDTGDAKLIPFNVGGRYQLVSNTELEYPVIPTLGISLVTFLDAGTAFDRFPGGGAQTATDLDHTYLPAPLMRMSLGWGIRWWSPIGPLRFEFGYPLIRPMGEPTVDAQFAIAPTF